VGSSTRIIQESSIANDEGDATAVNYGSLAQQSNTANARMISNCASSTHPILPSFYLSFCSDYGRSLVV
jgi:hypothetical protein